MPYRVGFENEPSAAVPAQVVTVADNLQSDLDWTTFELTDIGFGDVRLAVPPKAQHFETSVPMTFNGVSFEVQIETGIHLATGEVYANFYTIDPNTGLPPTVDIGFLPPEDGTGRGEGYFAYLVKPKPGLPAGTEIRNVARITFDYQETVATNQVDPHDPSQGTDPNKEALNTIAPAMATLTVNTSAGGSVTAPGIGAFTYDWGEQVSLTAVASAGYSFVSWTSTICPIADPNDPITTVGVYDNCLVTANFAALAVETPTPTPTAIPTITPSPTPTPTAVGAITGRIRYYSADRPVPSTTVHVSGCTDQTSITDPAGRYAFSNVPAGACALQTGKADTAKDGISALDAAYVLQQVVGLRVPALDQFQQLACDVTGNGTISALDAARILQRVVDIISRFPVAQSCTSDWTFWPMPLSASHQTLIPPVMSTGACQPGGIDLNPLSPPATGQDFYGIKFGDCTGNWQPPGGGGSAAAVLSAESARVSLGRPRPGRNGRLRIPVYVHTTSPFLALELELTHDPSELRVTKARVARSGQGALVRFDSDAAGRVKVALATGTRIGGDVSPVLTLELEPLDGSARGRIELRSAAVDDRRAEMD